MEMDILCHMVIFVYIVSHLLFTMPVISGENIEMKIMVFTDLQLEGPCQEMEENVQIGILNSRNIKVNMVWRYTTTTLQTIFEVNKLLGNDTDIVIINSHSQVFQAVHRSLQSKGIFVIHWPARNIFSNEVPRNLLKDECICGDGARVIFKLECPCYTDDRFTEFSNCSTWYTSEKPSYSKSLIIAKVISLMKTKNLFVLIQTDKDSDFLFDTTVLDTFNSKLILYDSDALRTEDRIRKVLTDATEIMKVADVQVLLICDKQCIMNILKEAAMMSKMWRFETILRLLSKWLIFGDKEMEAATIEITTTLNNMAFVPVSTSDVNQLKTCTNTMYRTGIKDQIMANTVSTLLLQPHGPEYSSLDTVKGVIEGRQSVSLVFPNINKGFNGRRFTVGIITFPPFVIRENRTGSVTYSGYCIDLLMELSLNLNFTYKLVEPEDGQWGMRNPDGNWTGLVGLLQKKKVDIVVADLSIDPSRETVMDFTYPFYYEYVAGLLKKPDPSKDKWKTYFNPFSWEVYIMIVVTVPVTSFFLFLVEKYNPYYTRVRKTNSDGLHRFRDSLWFILGALLSQGGVHRPDSITGRTLVSFFCLFSIIILALYSGNLIAFLTVSKDEPPFTDVKGLLNQEDYNWGLLNGTLWVTFFKESTKPQYKAMWEHIEKDYIEDPTVLSGSHEVHLQKVREGNYMYIGVYTLFENIKRNDSDCNLLIMEDKLFPHEYGIGLQNNSPYKDIFSEKVMSIAESGLPAMWKNKWWQKTAFCSGGLVAESKPIVLIDIQSAFYLIIIGGVVAGLTLVTEKLLFNVSLRHNRRQPSGINA